MATLKKGDKVDLFQIKDQNDKIFKFEDYKGKKLLFSWHPMAWTGICGQQMMDLEERYDKFMDMGVVPFGASIDHAPCKKAWAEELELQKLPLLCDFWPHGEIAKKFGIFHENFGFAGRVHILVDENGEILYIHKYQIKEQPDFDEFIDEIKEVL